MDVSLFDTGIQMRRARTPLVIQPVPAPDRLRLLLQQVAGAASVPVVQKGDAVVRGQLLAEGAAGLHAPIAGTVRGIEEIPGLDGSPARVLVIEGDGSAAVADLEADGVPLKREPQLLLDRIRSAGIVQAGREPMPLATLLEQSRAPRGHLAATGRSISRPVRHLVVRCIDMDPQLVNLAAVTASLKDDANDVALGIELLLRLTDAESVHLVLAQGQPVGALAPLADQRDWSVLRLPRGRYPAAHEALVAARVSGQEPNTAWQRVHASGTVVLDVDTVLQVTAALRDGQPVLDRVVTVSCGGRVRAMRAPLGTPFSALTRAAGATGEWGKAVLGGPMQGLAYHSLDFPVAKHLPGLYLLRPEQVPSSPNHPCISCGLCAMTCPMRLVPGMLSRFCEFGQWEAAEDAHLFTCIECGCCAYVCPAERSMVQLMVQAKSEVLAARRTA